MGSFTFPPDDLKSGAALLGSIGEVLFSEGTYQIEVRDGETYWPFLQLSDDGQIKDHFCTCRVGEETGSCLHQAAAFLKIFNGKSEPLHMRFRISFWNALCQMAGRRHGYNSSILKGDLKKELTASSQTKKELFSLSAKTESGRKKIKEMIKSRPVETEETSLKFSNLQPEELMLWKQGRPSHLLQYELSFWSDLAKWLFLMQEAGTDYKIQFSTLDTLPKQVKIIFPDVECEFYIAEANWQQIIPSLATASAPLQVFEFTHQQIKRIIYDPLKKAFLLDIVVPKTKEKEVEGQVIGAWIFVPKKGFYPAKLDPLLKEKVVHQPQVAHFLRKYPHFIEKHLAGAKMNLDPIKAKYHLYFDKDEALHVVSYIFEMGDLQKLNSVYYGPWVYLAEKGFYCLSEQLFDGIEKVIPKAQLSDFINKHRHWLSSYPGFETHVGSLEPLLSFHLTDKKELMFDSKVDLPDETEAMIDLVDWIFVKGRGFYAKGAQKTGKDLKIGAKIPYEKIPSFIQTHIEELEAIPGFFTDKSPVTQSGLSITLNEAGRIVVQPSYTFSAKNITIFENYTYEEGSGFCEVPTEFKLGTYFKETVIDPNVEPYFVAFEIDALKSKISHIDNKLCKPESLKLKISNLEREESFWLLTLDYESEFGQIDPMTLWEALNEQKRYLFSAAGLILIKGARFNWLKGITKRRWLHKGTQVRLTSLELMRLLGFETVLPPDLEEARDLFHEFINFTASEEYNLKGLQSQLRGYQETGLKWLWFLYVYGLSGLLCDEMGLGKTHQAMALIAAAKNRDDDAKFLVVCPTSVIYHWKQLLSRFLPSLRVSVFYGINRTLEDFQENYDLLLTSYGTLRSEKNPLSEIPFSCAIFDEIQIAKNANSQTHKALKLIEAKTRLGLTGTPIENRLLELKALFDVVLPSYLPTETQFKELFVNPIEKQNDQERSQLLKKIIQPFVLRRRKSEVLQELPEKTEEIAYADLSDEQRALYKEAYLQSREVIQKEVKAGGQKLPFIHIFALITKLKQICDHPSLVLNDVKNYKEHKSGKWDLFVELLHETRDSGQKLVVFSQYLGMLDIIENYLSEHNIGYATIRGSTRNRAEQIEKFQNDPKCEVFVGSLQAAGVGIDLVAASVVIHYDRWWNPAKENQATDRVHRIGQSRGVQVFKMVAKDTIEEHIHTLIERKLALLEKVLDYDDEGQVKSLKRDELLEILRLLEATAVQF